MINNRDHKQAAERRVVGAGSALRFPWFDDVKVFVTLPLPAGPHCLWYKDREDLFRFDRSLPSADFQRAGGGQLWIDFTRFLWGQRFFDPSTIDLSATLPATFVGTFCPAPSLRARGILLLSTHQRSALGRWVAPMAARVVCTLQVDGTFDHGLQTCTGTAAAPPPDGRLVL